MKTIKLLTNKEIENFDISNTEVENLRNQQSNIATQLQNAAIGSKQHTTLLAMQTELASAFADSNSELETIEAQIQDVITDAVTLDNGLQNS
jgi:seryl-tRNA synthetase